MIIEALFEDVQLKQNILCEIEQKISNHCIIALTTSVLSIREVVTYSQRPEKVN